MDFNSEKLSDRINQKLIEFFKSEKRRSPSNPFFLDLIERIKDLTLRKHDFLRPLLVNAGYCLVKGETSERLINLSLAVELFHSACLIHDDIMDKSDFRRNGPSVNAYFSQKYNPKLGNDLAILAGDLAMLWADQLFFSSGLKAELLLKAKPYFDSLRQEVVAGQTMDILSSEQKNLTEDYILRTYELKTAGYSFKYPLLLGAVLAGAKPKDLDILAAFANPVGIAFQIKDDILGTFGKVDQTGKSTDDLKEGKNTLLILKTKQLLKDNSIKNKFIQLLGNKNVSENELIWLAQTIKNSGALKHCQKLAEGLIDKGKSNLLGYNGEDKAKKWLLELTDFILAREE